MLIKCPKCEASFDIEKRGSVCPQCGTDIVKMKRKVKRTEKEKRVFLYQLIGSLVMIVLMIGAFVTSRVDIAHQKAEYEAPLGILEVQTIEPQRPMVIDGHVVKILDGEIIEGMEGHTPKGYSFLAVSYETSATYSLSDSVDIYLILPTGEYVKPLEKEAVLEVLDTAEVSLAGVTDYIDVGNGKVVFMVSNNMKNAMVAVYDKNNIQERRIADNPEDYICVYHILLEWKGAQ